MIFGERVMLSDNSFKLNSVYVKGVNFNNLDSKGFENAQALKIMFM